jgi:hypothetical protein
MDPFDTEAIKASMGGTQSQVAECVNWCLSAMESFGRAAQDVGTPVVALEMDSFAARAAGIAKAPWPTSSIDGKQVAQYYRILTNRGFEVWPAADGYGLTQSVDGQLFLKGKTSSIPDAAGFVAKAAGYDLEQAKEVFHAALRGEAYSVE